MGALDDFYSRVSSAIHRGDTFDSEIPGYALDAVRYLENLHNWVHMWTVVSGATLTAGNRDITIDATKVVKSVRFLRFHRIFDESIPNKIIYAYSRKKQPDDVFGASVAHDLGATGFYHTSRSAIRLIDEFETDQTYDYGYYAYSLMDDNLPWLTIEPGLLLAQTMVELGPRVRNDRLVARYERRADRKLSLLEESDLIHKYDGEDMQMTPYLNEIGQDLFATHDDTVR